MPLIYKIMIVIAVLFVIYMVLYYGIVKIMDRHNRRHFKKMCRKMNEILNT